MTLIRLVILYVIIGGSASAQEFEQVNTTSPQTLENKTLTSPNIAAPTISGTISGTPTIPGATITNPTITGTVGGGATYPGVTITSPTISGTISGSPTITSPTLTTPTLTTPSLSNPTITGTVSGSPTITTPTLTTPTINNPVLNLPSYTKAGLPAAGTAGRLARVSDDARGVWMDQSIQWFALNGQVYDVKEFGAKGDDTADDTTAIQAAITAAQVAGGIVWFPIGTYKITTELVAKSYVILMGSSMYTTAIHNANTSSGDAIHFTDTTTGNSEVRYCMVTGLRVYGNASSGDGITVDNAYQFSLHRVYIDQHGGKGVNALKGTYGSTYGQNIWISESWINVNRGGGIKIGGSSNGQNHVNIQRSSINQNAYYGIYLDRTNLVSINDCELAIYRYASLIAGHQAIPIVINGGSSVRINSVSFEDNGGNGATPNTNIRTGWDGDAQAAASNDLQNLTVENSDFKSTGGGAEGAINHITLNRTHSVSIEKNFFEKEGGYANAVNGVSLGADMLTAGGLAFRSNYWNNLDAKLTGVVRPVLWDDVYFDSPTLSAPNARGGRCTDAAQIVLWNRYDVDTYDNFRVLCGGASGGLIALGDGTGVPAQVLSRQTLTLQATLFAALGTPANGTIAYCSDCAIASPCAGAGTGAIAKRLNSVWVCN